jgi:hypothetical protein
VRAVTHAAFKVALVLYCHERGLPHPGFLNPRHTLIDLQRPASIEIRTPY